MSSFFFFSFSGRFFRSLTAIKETPALRPVLQKIICSLLFEDLNGSENRHILGLSLACAYKGDDPDHKYDNIQYPENNSEYDTDDRNEAEDPYKYAYDR